MEPQIDIHGKPMIVMSAEPTNPAVTRYRCGACRFSPALRAGTVRDHIQRTHLRELKFRCELCGTWLVRAQQYHQCSSADDAEDQKVEPHTPSVSSGQSEFQCRYCGQIMGAATASHKRHQLKRHEAQCMRNPDCISEECAFCHKLFTAEAVKTHRCRVKFCCKNEFETVEAALVHQEEVHPDKPVTGTCPHCHDELKTWQSLCQHCMWCKFNPNVAKAALFRCRYCSHTSTASNSILKHSRAHHQQQAAEAAQAALRNEKKSLKKKAIDSNDASLHSVH